MLRKINCKNCTRNFSFQMTWKYVKGSFKSLCLKTAFSSSMQIRLYFWRTKSVTCVVGTHVFCGQHNAQAYKWKALEIDKEQKQRDVKLLDAHTYSWSAAFCGSTTNQVLFKKRLFFDAPKIIIPLRNLSDGLQRKLQFSYEWNKTSIKSFSFMLQN